ncbi:hypothetical protein G6F16_012721 [Rhizopus arrhizus]|nr:hypothetical protein G6F20_013637 [Rhizopus arrhizus]KAG0811564.1 hypothetical protein G6F18_013492 [Rhizopus arrhizus]KAG0819183.1 hypothetical protein G6F19_012620 [Rhizopus arrhizus]KAG0841686.1 hypothetical protein G6F17_013697 [Rhizopus arrhizus]KAG0862180.1 hypothetical protein G6F16_012721 [Rhizopus arrhizus]
MNKTTEQVPVPMANKNDNMFSMDMDTYITKVYQEQGYEAALTVMNDFLIMWEDCNVGPTNLTYEIDGITYTREEYAIYTIEGYDQGTQDYNWEKEDDLELLMNIEALIQNQYEQYKEAIREIERLQELKDSLCELISMNVSRWAHFKFRRPKPTPESVSIYIAAKQTALKTIVPGYSLFRALSLKIKQSDVWSRIEDDSSRGPTICNTEAKK